MSLHNKKLEAFLSVSVVVWKRIQNQILIWQKFSLFFMFSAITAKSTTTFKKKYVSKGPDSGKSDSSCKSSNHSFYATFNLQKHFSIVHLKLLATAFYQHCTTQ